MQFALEQQKIHMVDYIQPVLFRLVVGDRILSVCNQSAPGPIDGGGGKRPTHPCTHDTSAHSQTDI